ncbi:fatty acid desaturase family protein [Gorgonomyces haynaldii]|nr:fatty acid desaturase family protein [Gorgonomyces haynaldii]
MRAFPRNHLSDTVLALFGLLIPLAAAPIMAISMPLSVWSLELMRMAQLDKTYERITASADSWVRSIGKQILRDERDASLLPYYFFINLWSVTLFGSAIVFYKHYGFSIGFLFVYHLLRLGPRFRFFAHAQTLFHKEGHCHKGLFKGSFSVLNNWFMQCVSGPIYGCFVNFYPIYHNKDHHRFDNGPEDMSTTLDLDRSKTTSFFVYLARFSTIWTNCYPIYRFFKKQEQQYAVKLSYGLIYHIAFIAASWIFVGPLFAYCYCIYPAIEAMIFLCGISYMWHCFADPKDPLNPYVSSVTILEGKDNIWGEDYHVIHHTLPKLHFSEGASYFGSHLDEYKKNKATIFKKTEEGEILYLLLSKNWDKLADLFVDLSGQMTHEQKKDLLLTRLRYTF